MAEPAPDAGMADPAAAAAAVAEQQHQLQQQVQVALEGIFHRLGALELQQAGPPAPALPYPTRDKPPKPETFKGTTEQATHVRMWVTMVKNYFAACNTPHEQKLPYAVALLREAALVWYQGLDAAQVPDTFESFCTSLIEYYQPISAQMAARDELANLKQTGTVKEYTDVFKRVVANIPDLSSSEKMDRYERGLKDNIRVHVALADPSTFEDWVKRAEKVDEIMNKRPGSSSATLSSSQGSSRDAAETPMEIDAIGTVNTLPRRRLSPEERQALMDSGACFYCRKPGHIAAECPRKRK